MASIDYKSSGVHRDLADQFVDQIVPLSKSTHHKHRKNIKTAVGGYASLYAIDKNNWIAASTDGVGTKLKLAFELNTHDTVGIDLVAMSVNDLICVGARPLFFLDYLATGKLNKSVSIEVLKGIVEGCKQGKCALMGGETAEMPGFYVQDEYDLAGFAVGLLHPKNVLPKKIIPGDVLIGLPSSGFHSNGFSLIRRLLDSLPAKQKKIWSKKVMLPTRIYVEDIMPLIDKKWIKGLSHITGSGFLNLPRVSDQFNYKINLPKLSELASHFKWIREFNLLSFDELCSTFNMGIGMILVVSKKDSLKVLKYFSSKKKKAFLLGEVERRPKKQKIKSIVSVTGSEFGELADLKYD